VRVLPGLVALGIVQGLLSALFAAGLVVAHRTHRFLNLAQAGFGLVAGSVVGVLIAQAGWSFWAAAPIGIATGAALGALAERVLFARLYQAPRLILMVASLGLAQVLGAFQTALPLAVGGVAPSYSVSVGTVVRIFPVVLSGAHLVTLVVAPIALGLLGLYLKSRAGLGAQAVGQNAERARSLGVPAPAVSTLAFAVVGAAGAVAGILAVPVLGYSLDGTPGVAVLLLALAPAAVAGFRNLGQAAAAAVLLGVAYQLLLWFGGQARIGTALLALVAGVAVALRPPAGDRVERAQRAASWPAAPPVRPWGGPRWVAPLIAVMVVGFAALWVLRLGPADAQLVATGAALALGALSLSVGWCLAGELSLAAWPAAGVSALFAGIVSRSTGPAAGAIVGLAVGASLAVLLGAVVRRHGGLAFAIVSLAASAVLADIAGLEPFTDGGPPSVTAAAAAMAAIALTAAATAAIGVLRTTRAGHRMVAARDDARRARAFGVKPSAQRLVGLALSGGLAGLAGLTYLLAVPDPAPGTFAAERALDLLAMAVVGGLGSFWGAAAGAVALVAVRTGLDGSWALLGSGAGMLVALLFAPGGLALAADRLRRAVLR
jgi:branched-chain amino acid transport system permease protein